MLHCSGGQILAGLTEASLKRLGKASDRQAAVRFSEHPDSARSENPTASLRPSPAQAFKNNHLTNRQQLARRMQ
jgi:hypothetical protein